MARRPDLFIIGAPKSGTTSLYEYLDGHPDVCLRETGYTAFKTNPVPYTHYDPVAKGPDAGAGLIRGGFWPVGDEPPGSEGFPRDDYCGMGEQVFYTGHH